MVKKNIDFLDKAKIEVISGNGGDGVIAWRREKYAEFGGPAGGDGARGGSVYLQATNNLNTLSKFRYTRKFMAENGKNGGSMNKSGLSGEDNTVLVPTGTSVYRIQRDSNNIETREFLGDLKKEGQKLLVAIGGKGGRGNQHFATSTKQAPYKCEPGQKGQEFTFELELKLIAEVGLLGMPNAGKSTLLSVLSSARPKIANYPFTTLVPNLGICRINEDYALTIADIPGLIEGASQGVGLGFQFLRHVERTKVLLHLLDLSVAEFQSIEELVKIYTTIRDELGEYKESILDKKEVILFNKIDICSEETIQEIKKQEIFKNKDLLFISGATQKGIEELKAYFLEYKEEFLAKEDTEDNIINTKELLSRELETQEDFVITVDEENRVFEIKSTHIEGLIRVTKFTKIQSVNNLYMQLDGLGLLAALEEKGIESGDTILVGKKELTWSDYAEYKFI